jgi:hypothetical protein
MDMDIEFREKCIARVMRHRKKNGKQSLFSVAGRHPLSKTKKNKRGMLETMLMSAIQHDVSSDEFWDGVERLAIHTRDAGGCFSDSFFSEVMDGSFLEIYLAAQEEQQKRR